MQEHIKFVVANGFTALRHFSIGGSRAPLSVKYLSFSFSFQEIFAQEISWRLRLGNPAPTTEVGLRSSRRTTMTMLVPGMLMITTILLSFGVKILLQTFHLRPLITIANGGCSSYVFFYLVSLLNKLFVVFYLDYYFGICKTETETQYEILTSIVFLSDCFNIWTIY